MTRGQLSRHQREQQQIRRLYFIMGGVGALVALILAVALVSTYVIQPNTEVGKVGNETITRAAYNKYRAWQIYNQMRILQFYIQQDTQTPQSAQTTQYQTQITQLQQELVGLDTWPTIDSSTLSQLADNMFIAQKAGDVKVSLTDDEALAAARKNFEPQPTPIPGPTDTPGPTNTPGTPTATATATPTGPAATPTATATGTPPTATPTITSTPTQTHTPGPSPTATQTPTITPTPLPVPGAQQTAEASYNDFIKAIAAGPKPSANGYCSLGCPGLSAQDYLNLVARPDELKKKITEALGANVPKTQDEVHAAHILVADVATANDIKAQLDKGADFATLAAKYSTDTSNKDSGGDLGWFAPTAKGGTMVQEFSDAAFALTKPGQISDPVKSQFGWHIIKLIERGPRDLSASDIDTAKTKAFDDWLAGEKTKCNCITLHVPPTATPVPTQAPLPTSIPQATLPPAAPITGTGSLSGTGTLPATTPGTGTTPPPAATKATGTNTTPAASPTK